MTRYNLRMHPWRITGNIFLICYLYITACAFLFTVIRAPVFIAFPSGIISYSYGMTAPYQSAAAPHGQMHVECRQGDQWAVIDLTPFYPQIFGERNAREYFAMFAYSGNPEDSNRQHEKYAAILMHLLADQGTHCDRMRLAWDKWPMMTGPFETLHLPAFTTRIPLYGYDEE
jgi:hypothetical protein